MTDAGELPPVADSAEDAGHGDLVATVAKVWAHMLGQPSLGPRDDFFDFGGSSLLVVATMAQLSERFGLELPPRALFEAPTPAEMAELLAERLAVAPDMPLTGFTPVLPEWVIPLQREGAGRPVFVFPIVHDEMRALAAEAQMAAQVGRAHPFWGFRREDPRLATVREGGVAGLAAAYIAQVRKLQGEGPYLLYGNCAGGYMAWAVADQLLAEGERVSLLFYEVPLRADVAAAPPVSTPASHAEPWMLARDYTPPSLSIDLTMLMTDNWQVHGWWAPWRQVTGGAFETIVIPVQAWGEKTFAFHRSTIVAGYVRDWIARAEARVGRA